MKKLLLLTLAALMTLAVSASAQDYNFNYGGLQYSSGAAVPGSCSRDGSYFFKNTAPTGWSVCQAGVYGAIGGSGITTGATLPTTNCSPGQLFNDTEPNPKTSLLWRNLTNSGTACNWQQIKPTIETIYAKDYGVLATSGVVADGTTASGSPNVSCPNSDCNFSTSVTDARPIVLDSTIFFATNAAGTLVCPQTTIHTVTDAQHIVLNANCTVSQTANANIAWGPDDSTALANAWSAAVTACNTLQLPAGVMLVQAPMFNSPGTGCAAAQTWQVPGVFGASSTGTVIIPTPGFSFTNCSGGLFNACFFGVNFQLVFYLKVWGLGYSPAGCGANKLSENSQGLMFDVVFTQWCTGGTGIGTDFFGQQAEGLFGGTVQFGATQCRLNGLLATLGNWPCYGGTLGLEVTNGAVGISQGGFLQGSTYNIQVDAGGVFNSFSDRDFTGGNINILGKWNAHGYSRVAPTGNDTVFVRNGGILNTINSTWTASNSGNNNGLWATVNPGGIIQDEGGNTYGGGTVAAELPQVIQARNCSPGAGTTAACAYTNNTVAGNFDILIVEITNVANTISGCTGSSSGAWTQQGTSLDTPSVNHPAVRSAVFFKTNITGGADTITCTFSGSSTANISIAEYQGVALASPIDTSQTNTGSGSAVSTTSPTTTLASDLVIFLGNTNFGGTLTPGTGYALLGPTFNGNSGTFVQVRADTYAAAAYTATATESLSTIDWVAFTLAVKSANPTATNGPFRGLPQSGTCTFVSTTCTVTFATSFQTVPACSASDQTAAAPIKTTPSKTQVVLLGGTGAGTTDVAAWHCQ